MASLYFIATQVSVACTAGHIRLALCILKADIDVQLIETTRLQGRQFSLNDVADLTVILSDPEVMKYSLNGIYNEAATREFIEWCLKCYNTHGFGPLAQIEKKSSKLVGFCGIYPEEVERVSEIGLGYRFSKKHWGKGLASESCKAIVDFAFVQKKVDSIVVIVEPDHIASIRVAEKVGFSGFESVEFNGRIVRLYRLNRKNA